MTPRGTGRLVPFTDQEVAPIRPSVTPILPIRRPTTAAWSALVWALVVPGALASQTFEDVDPRPLEKGPIILELPASTRAQALGDAYGGQDADAVFYHPALLPTTGIGGSLQRYGQGGTLITLSGATAWWDGAVSVGLQTLEFGAASARTDELLRDEGSLAVQGDVAAAEFVASFGYAKEVVEGVRLGAVGKVLGQRLAGTRGTSVALDVGASTDLGPVTLALSAQNLGNSLDGGTRDLPLAQRVTVGAFTGRTPVGPLDVGAAARITRDGSGDVLPGGGLEVAWWPVFGRTFIARIGARRVVDGVGSPLTFGGGFAGDRIRLDYAYQGFDSVDGAHRFGLSFR